MIDRSLDTLLQLVADRRRRQVIHYLRHEAMGQTTIDELVDALSHPGSGAEDQLTDRRQLAIQLYHVHLPTLAAHGVVEFDPDTQAVRYQADEHTEQVLDSFPDELSLARS